MVRGLSILVALLGLSVGTAVAQEVDARAALLASLKAMGGENLKTIEIAAAGSTSLIGQQFSRGGQLAADRGRQLHARHRLRRQVVARGLHAAAGQLSHVRPGADGRAARHGHRQRLLRLGHATTACRCRSRVRISTACRSTTSGSSSWRSRPTGSSRRRWRPPMRRRSGCSTSAHRTSGCRSSAGG